VRTVYQAQQGLDIWGSFTPHQLIKSSSWRELFGAGKHLETFGPILSGTVVSIHLDSQVAVVALGGTIPTYPNKFSEARKLLSYRIWCLGYMIQPRHTTLAFEPCGFL